MRFAAGRLFGRLATLPLPRNREGETQQGWIVQAISRHTLGLILHARFGASREPAGRCSLDQMTTPLERPGLPDTSAPLFHADASGAPSLGQHPALDLLADLAMHDQAQTPLTIGLFGAPGAGKSHALQTLGRRARALAEAAGPQSPFLDHVSVVAVDAQDLQADAARGVAIALREGLLARGPKSLAARLDGKAVEAATDPLAAAQEAAQQLDDARRQLAAEQRDLTELTAQRARLNNAVLFESGHTLVDDYARRHRKQLETRLNSFGFGGDAKAVFKTLVG